MAKRNRFLKRIFDLTAVLLFVPVWLPLGLLFSLLVAINLGRPIFFLQERPGLHGKPFRLIKFRTMTDGRDPEGRLLPDEQRMTALGKMMRRLSFDEIPEVINVLKGEMSCVGPRPLLMSYLTRYTPEQARRHEVPPGVTGLAQINGRNAISWEEKFAHDVWYVDHGSLLLDLRIFFRTAGFAFRRQGINQPGHATMEEFQRGGISG